VVHALQAVIEAAGPSPCVVYFVCSCAAAQHAARLLLARFRCSSHSVVSAIVPFCYAAVGASLHRLHSRAAVTEHSVWCKRSSIMLHGAAL
jgi:hypothetical protein